MNYNNFLPYKQSLELKELGFNEICFGFYPRGYSDQLTIPGSEDFTWLLDEVRVITNRNLDIIGNPIGLVGYVAAPLYQQAFRWFRENHDLCSHIMMYNGQFTFEINEVEFVLQNKETHEESELDCLNKLIEIIKK